MKQLLVLPLLPLTATIAFGASAALADPSQPTFGTFVNAGDVAAGSKLVLNITLKVTNDEDSGNAGYWALGNHNKHVQVWQVRLSDNPAVRPEVGVRNRQGGQS